jgi:FkbM family methyltransferase
MFISYAQNFEDVILWRALRHIPNGFYIDVGAQHPIKDSVSKLFYEQGWRGVHFEPTPTHAALLRGDRPDEQVFELALGNHKGTLEFFEITDSGLSTADPAIASKHLADYGIDAHRISVPVLPAREALAPYAGRPVHWLKVDVEGAERAVLEGWNFQQIAPWIVVVEATEPLSQAQNHQDWEPILLGSGYQFVYWDGLNRFYLHDSQIALKHAFSAPPNVWDGFALSGQSYSKWCAKVLQDLNATQQSVQAELANRDVQIRRLRDQLHAVPSRRATSVVTQRQAWSAYSPTGSGRSTTHALRGVFSNIYSKDVWDGGSGPGSRLENIGPYFDYLQRFLSEKNIKSLVDCGCGDWQSTQYIDLSGISYTGIDIVPSVIEANTAAHGKTNVQFICANFSEIDLPAADLAICKDALQHLPNENIFGFLKQMHKFRYVLITNDLGDNTGRDATVISNPYHFARLDVSEAPFAVRAERVCEMSGNKVTHLVTDTAQFTSEQNRGAESRLANATVKQADETDALATVIADSAPKVLVAILAKQKEATLPFYLRCIEALDYPKSSIALYIRTNNNTDRTADLLREWLARVGGSYASVEIDCSDVEAQVQQYGVHEWNPTRFKVLGHIRQVSLQKALDAACDFYFVVDVDNFVRPNTLRDLAALNLPIVGPLLRHEAPENPYSNYHHEIDANGYFAASDEYHWLLNQRIRGVTEVKVIHCTYLIRTDVIPDLSYDDGTGRYEYVIFSSSARSAGIPQYLDTRQVYGYLTLEESTERCELLIGAEIDAALG